jgi:Spy/CpxP family protein refolding chaperone
MTIKTPAMKLISRMLLPSGLLMLLCFVASGQRPGDHEKRMEEYKAMKIAYFTENLGLTPQEAQKFWPLYNQYEQEKAEFRRNRMDRSKEFAVKVDQLSEKEAEEIIDKHIENRQKELDLDVQFNTDLKKILPAKKIMKLYITEVQFREYILRQIREHRDEPDQKRERQIP